MLPAYLASFSDLVGVVVIRDSRTASWRRLRSEWRRSRWRILDALAFRSFYRLRFATRDREWIRNRAAAELGRLASSNSVPVYETDNPNTDATRRFLEDVKPELALAACRTLLRPEIFNVPTLGTYVVHPGICPEYRNSHGCFWALARRDLERVGATLLRIDEGADTGPVYAYYRTEIDEASESHVVIQTRVVYDNLEQISRDLQSIYAGSLQPIDVTGRSSAAWGQPRLTDYLRWKRAARKTAA